ncbi:MAG: universal stress protein [Nitrosopumilaceae archaeon]|nr:universal stress protein [Nitrosopumilaceae archaeon]
MYKTILVSHGGTPAGDEALRHAIHLAKSDSAKIIILHVIEDIPVPASFALASSERDKLHKDIADANNAMKASMENQLNEKVEECKNAGIDCERIVMIGDAAENILKLVLDKDIDLLVMAKRRKLKGLKKLLSLGSVSRKVVEHVSCPVYLIDIENI